VSLRIRWQSEDESGAFPLRTHPLHLVCTDSMLDMVAQPPIGQNGLTLSPPDAEGRIQLKAYGEFRFNANDRHFDKVRLPIGGKVEFVFGEVRGHLYADGEAPVVDPLVGTILNGHQLLGRLGAGAVGVVYRAKQLNLDREVALKMLNQEAAKKPLAVASFRREAQAAGRLSHPNLVQVYDVGQEGKKYYYTMELVPGGNFEEHLAEHGPMDWREAVTAVRDCCRALAYAQEHELVHRDVKPENLMIGAGGVVKLADLGLAATRSMLALEAAGGTPHFMAPEAVGKGQTDHRSDLYSVGCTLYRLLTGETVFVGSSVKEILLAHRDEEPPTLRGAGLDVPRDLDELLAELLAKDPDDRPDHANDVAEFLEDLLAARSSRWLTLLAVPLLGIGAWGVYQALQEPPIVEPERVIEYVENASNAQAEAELALLQEEREAYFDAKAVGLGLEGLTALQGFLAAYPSSAFKEDALAEIEQIRAALAAAESQPIETLEQKAKREAMEAATADVRVKLSAGNYGAARQLARKGILATEEAMLSLALLVDEIADAKFTEWENLHSQHLQAQNWAEASNLRSAFALAIGSTAPEFWQARLEELVQLADREQLLAKQASFLQDRLNFLQAAQEPVRQAVRAMNFADAAQKWSQAVQVCKHEAMAQLAHQEQELFDLAALGLQTIQARLAKQEIDLVEPLQQRKVQVLRWVNEGLVLRVQVDGERVERIDDWTLYQKPETLNQLVQVLGPEAGSEIELNAIFLLVAFDDLATQLEQLAEDPSPARAILIGLAVDHWKNSVPFPEVLSLQAIDSLQKAADLCQALQGTDDFLSLNRLEDFHATLSVLGVWTSQGQSTWGCEAE
jgi:protein kinase-like protein